MSNPIAEIKAIYANAGPEPRDGDYVELLDENDPEGAVVVRRADGSEVMVTSRATYEAIVAWGKKHLGDERR
jgi:hypothetical protein